MEKINGRANRRARTDSPMVDEAEVEKSFWLSRPDGQIRNMSLFLQVSGPWQEKEDGR